MIIKEFYYDEFMKKINDWQNDLDTTCQHELIVSEVIDAVLDTLNDSIINHVEMTKEEFDKLYVDYVVVNCKTEKDAEEFLEIADFFGYRWWDDECYLLNTSHHVYGENTCYKISEGVIADVEWFANDEPTRIVVYEPENKRKDKYEEL